LLKGKPIAKSEPNHVTKRKRSADEMSKSQVSCDQGSML
jgi:hypothetical protein